MNHRLSPPRFGKGGRRTIQCSKPKCVTFAEPQVPKMRFADARGILQHLFKHWLKVARRTANDFETSDVAVCRSSASANSRLRVAISFFRSTSAGAPLGFVGTLLLVGDLRTACPRFAIWVRSAPGKLK